MIPNLFQKSLVALSLTLGLASPLAAFGQAYPSWGQNPQQPVGRSVVINGVPVSPQQLGGAQIQPGRYWYDTQTGAWGMEGGGVQGFIQPGLSFGQLQSNASNGRTGVFINGRQLPQSDLSQLQRAVGGSVSRGRYWCRANGECGQEGNPQVIVDLTPEAGIVRTPEGGIVGEGSACFKTSSGELQCFAPGIGNY